MTAEHSIAPLAVDILPFVDETNCDGRPRVISARDRDEQRHAAALPVSTWAILLEPSVERLAEAEAAINLATRPDVGTYPGTA